MDLIKWQLNFVSCNFGLKAMLHEAIFLATCNATMTNKKPFKLQRGCHTFPTFLQLATRTITNKMAETLNERKMSSDWPILTKLRCKMLRGCYTQATCLATLRKVEGRSTFLATRNATIAVAVLHVKFFLANCNATNVALQVAREIASCNMALKSYLWFQIELALRARSILKSRVWFQTKLHSTQFNYHYELFDTRSNY